ncbi:hypothetical protein BX666DRAFT_2041427 [Dichotomocladium elegans]|nr:hypothetical protein BX666DRAFT_2041427 [Dichotomocladium elegans]
MTTLGRTPPMLSYFCVYNPTLGQTEENTKDQILYYTAKTVVPADVKMKQVGLAQALVNFSTAFSPFQPAQNVHAQKHRLIFFQPEPDFWMHMCVELGIMRKQTKDSGGKEKLVTEYLDHQLSDGVLERLLRAGYEQFRLLNGTMTSILKATGRRSSLMHLIEEFFSEWIWKWDFDRLDRMIFDVVFKGWPVQALSRQDHLRIRDLDIQLGKLFHIAHLFLTDGEGGRLIYHSSSLSKDDMVVLKHWVEQSQQMAIIAAATAAAAKPQSTRSSATTASVVVKTLTRSISNYFSASRTAYQSEEAHVQDDDDDDDHDGQVHQHQGKIEDVVRVHLASRSGLDLDEELEEYYLVVYKHKDGFLLCFLLPAFAERVEDWLAEPNSIADLEKAMIERNLEGILSMIQESQGSAQEKRYNSPSAVEEGKDV